MSSHSGENYPAKVEAFIDNLINMHLQVSDTYLSLGFYFRGNTALKDMVRCFRELAEEKRQSAYFLLMQNQHTRGKLFSDGVMQSPRQWNGSMDAVETVLALEKSLYQVLLDLHALGSANADSHLCNFLESYFLEKEVNVIKKIGDYLTKIHQRECEMEDLSEDLFEKLTFNSK